MDCCGLTHVIERFCKKCPWFLHLAQQFGVTQLGDFERSLAAVRVKVQTKIVDGSVDVSWSNRATWRIKQ